MRPTRLLSLLALQSAVATAACGTAVAADQRKAAAPVPPGFTDVPDDDGTVPLISPQSGPDAPEITIRMQGDTKIEEYRRDGRIYMIRVAPRLGPPYYLIDIAGDGRFVRHDGAAPVSAPAQWRIYQF
jgi:hypothetical protein